jgi:hypothetical protein
MMLGLVLPIYTKVTIRYIFRGIVYCYIQVDALNVYTEPSLYTLIFLSCAESNSTLQLQ